MNATSTKRKTKNLFGTQITISDLIHVGAAKATVRLAKALHSRSTLTVPAVQTFMVQHLNVVPVSVRDDVRENERLHLAARAEQARLAERNAIHGAGPGS